MSRMAFGLACLAFLASGCATQRYGRVSAVSDAERRLMTCDQIELEVAKTESFLKENSDQNAKFTGKDVLGFLGDFGIGNSMEYGEAMKSGTNHSAQLRTLQVEKNCTRSAIPVTAYEPAPPNQKPGENPAGCSAARC